MYTKYAHAHCAGSPTPVWCASNRMQQESDSSSRDSRLDFLSPEFSAEQALVCSPSKIQLPCPEVQPCDNLEHYASVVRGITRQPPPPPPPATCSQQQPQQQQKRAAVALSSQQKIIRTVKSVISTMESKSIDPLSHETHLVCWFRSNVRPSLSGTKMSTGESEGEGSGEALCRGQRRM